MSEPHGKESEAWGKAYVAEGITVYYNARRCVHVAECVRGLPQVFEPECRPWIRADLAPPQQIAEIVRRCPTGALHYQLANGAGEWPVTPTRVTLVPNGPITLRGDLVLPSGERDTRAALCRCGQSSNKPFCDGTHAKVGWRDGVEAATKQ